MLLVAIFRTPLAWAQTDPIDIGQWQEPPGGYDWPPKATHASLMPDGQVLTWQGTGHAARLWNTRSGDFTCMPNNNSILFCSGHASLASGSLLVVGGGYGNNGIKDTDIFCYGNCLVGAGSSPWIIKQDMNYGRWYPTCTTLGDGRVLTVAGTISPGVHATIP